MRADRRHDDMPAVQDVEAASSCQRVRLRHRKLGSTLQSKAAALSGLCVCVFVCVTASLPASMHTTRRQPGHPTTVPHSRAGPCCSHIACWCVSSTVRFGWRTPGHSLFPHLAVGIATVPGLVEPPSTTASGVWLVRCTRVTLACPLPTCKREAQAPSRGMGLMLPA